MQQTNNLKKYTIYYKLVHQVGVLNKI